MTRRSALLSAACIGLIAAVRWGAITAAQDEPSEPFQTKTVSAPVAYENLMLIVTTDAGVAAFDFLEAFENRKGDTIEYGVAYRFRFLAKDAKSEETGSARVFELYKKVDGDEQYSSDGDCQLKAGAITLPWSRGGPKGGWIYYPPENMKVQIANDTYFQSRMVGETVTERLDLRRFR